jgi:hypothetical protein
MAHDRLAGLGRPVGAGVASCGLARSRIPVAEGATAAAEKERTAVGPDRPELIDRAEEVWGDGRTGAGRRGQEVELGGREREAREEEVDERQPKLGARPVRVDRAV